MGSGTWDLGAGGQHRGVPKKGASSSSGVLQALPGAPLLSHQLQPERAVTGIDPSTPTQPQGQWLPAGPTGWGCAGKPARIPRLCPASPAPSLRLLTLLWA